MLSSTPAGLLVAIFFPIVEQGQMSSALQRLEDERSSRSSAWSISALECGPCQRWKYLPLRNKTVRVKEEGPSFHEGCLFHALCQDLSPYGELFGTRSQHCKCLRWWVSQRKGRRGADCKYLEFTCVYYFIHSDMVKKAVCLHCLSCDSCIFKGNTSINVSNLTPSYTVVNFGIY